MKKAIILKSEEESCVQEVLEDLVASQKEFKNFLHSKYYRHMLLDHTGEGLVPFILYKKKGNQEVSEFVAMEKRDWFTTPFLAVKEIRKESHCATVILLRPLDIDGYETTDLKKLFRLEKTSFCLEVDLSCFCAIQCLDPRLMNRKLPIIEPKW